MEESVRIILESEGELRLFFITAMGTTRVMKAEKREYSTLDPHTGNIILWDRIKGAPRTVCTKRLLSVRGSAGEWKHEMLKDLVGE